MSIKKFEDFENSLEEDDKKALMSDHINAKKDLLEGHPDKIKGPLYFIDNGDDTITIWAKGENEDDQLDKPVIVKIIGYAGYSFKELRTPKK